MPRRRSRQGRRGSFGGRGLDLKPVDLANPPEVAWLEALVWPEQTDRLARLRAAIQIAVEQKPRLVKGDLRTDLAALTQEAPKNATLVIVHTVVLAYISAATERPLRAAHSGAQRTAANKRASGAGDV
jgi:hypothetical protein